MIVIDPDKELPDYKLVISNGEILLTHKWCGISIDVTDASDVVARINDHRCPK